MKKPRIEVKEYRNAKTAEFHRLPYKFLLDLRAYGKGRKFFKTRIDADNECSRQKKLLEIHSRAAIGLSQREMSEIIHAKQELAKYEKTINDATKFYVDHLERVRRCKVTVSQLAGEVLEAKRKDGMSQDYLSDLELRLRRFGQVFGDRPIASVTVEEIDDWLRNLEGSPKSRSNYRANVGVMFSYAAKRRMIDSNPVTHTAKPKLVDASPEIFAVDELQSLLDTAAGTRRDVLPMLAIGAFAGLRDAEIRRLDWNEVDLSRGHIEVKAAKAKSAKRRIVPIQPNLAEWLRPYSEAKGPIVPEGARGKLERVRKAANLANWPLNGLRHSYASYRLAAIHDAPRVAAELGHTSPQMLYSTYRELVLPTEAERYWKIEPAAKPSFR